MKEPNFSAETGVRDALGLVVASARAQKVREFEAFAICRKARRIVIDSGRVSSSQSSTATGLHVRVSVDGRLGGAFCNDYRKDEISKSIAQAVKVALLMEADSRWSGFASCDGRYPQVDGIHDPAVARMDVEVLCSMAEEMVEGAMSVSREVSTPYGATESVEVARGICNSSGIDAVMKETELYAGVCTIAGSGSKVSPDCENSGRSRTSDLDVRKIGEVSGWVAERSINLVDAKTEECDVVFAPGSNGDAETGLLNIVLSKAFSGLNVLQGITFLGDKVGQHIWSDAVTLVDNPVLSGRCGSRSIDDEGMPTMKTRLVRKGVLEGYLWDSRNGTASGEGSTGNAVRDMASGVVSPAPLCLQLAPDRGTLISLVESVDHGYLIWAGQGAHTSNTETGGFSFVASPGLLIEKGEVVGGVRGAMVSGNVSELMSNVERVGSDVHDFGNALIPSILIRNVNITTG